MIRAEIKKTMTCDFPGCGQLFAMGAPEEALPDITVINRAVDNHWAMVGSKHFCPGCHEKVRTVAKILGVDAGGKKKDVTPGRKT